MSATISGSVTRATAGQYVYTVSNQNDVQTADENGAGVDLAGAESAEIVFCVGESNDTLSGSVYIECEVEHSDDNSTYTDCADADLTTTVTGTNTGTIALIDAAAEDDVYASSSYIGSKRYIRAVINVTGTHTNGTSIGSAVRTSHLRRSV